MSKQDFSIRVEAGALDDRGSLARLSEALEDLGAELAFKDGGLVVRRRRVREVREDLPMHCLAYQVSDQMHCDACGLAWDVNDPDPPDCPRDESPRFTPTIRG